MAEMMKRYFNTEVVHLSQGRFWKGKCHWKFNGDCGVCKFSHMHSENDAEFRKLMMQCNPTSLNANDDPDWTGLPEPPPCWEAVERALGNKIVHNTPLTDIGKKISKGLQNLQGPLRILI